MCNVVASATSRGVADSLRCMLQARALQKEKEDLEKAVADTRGSVSGLQRSVAVSHISRPSNKRG